jgi:hypothetical protein
MQHTELLHNLLEKSGAIKHKGRLNSLMTAVSSVMNGANLSLTSMGRHVGKDIKPKSKIKEIDYLLGNGSLHRERLPIYKAVNEWVIGQEKILLIVIDWSSIVAHQHHMLRASIIRKGRCMTVYEEIYPEKQLANRESHELFLKNLKRVLPEGREVIIIADAGFRTDFFMQVQTNDWDFLARVLSNMKYTKEDVEQWYRCPELYEQATSEPADVGAVILAKSNKINCHLYLYKKLKDEADKTGQARVRKITHGKREKDYSNAARKPWLIASSINLSAEKIIKIYSKRMKIEHDFRDSKDPKWGLGMRESRSRDPMRLIIQLLIGFLASFMLWLIGLCLEEQGRHRDFQANSIKHKRVLSLIFLALEAVRNGYMKFISKSDFVEIKHKIYDEEMCSIFVGIT